MPRVAYIKKAQRDWGTCFNCRTEVKKGDSFKRASLKTGPRSSMTRVWCNKCTPKQSQLTISKMSGLYAAQEGFNDSVNGIAAPTTSDEATAALSELQSALETCAEELRSVSEEYRESAQNIEDGFGHATYQSDELNEKADSIDSWADDIEGVSLDDPPEEDKESDDQEHLEEALSSWWEDQVDNAQSEVDNCPV